MDKVVKKNKLSMRHREWVSGYLFLVPNFLGFFFFMLVPIIMGFVISFTNYDGFRQFDFVGLDNYKYMFQDEYFNVSLKNNILFTFVTVPTTIVLATLLAVGINAVGRGSTLLRTMFFFPYISSMVAVGIVWSILFNPSHGPINALLIDLGINNPPRWLASTDTALWTVMIVTIWKQAGYFMIILLAGLKNIPEHLYEAANIDGANCFVKFFKITLPMLSPITFMVTVLSVIQSFQVFDLINIMTKGGPGRATNVIVYRIYQEGFMYMRYGYASAMAYFLFFIILIFTLVQFKGQKKWVNY